MSGDSIFPHRNKAYKMMRVDKCARIEVSEGGSVLSQVAVNDVA